MSFFKKYFEKVCGYRFFTIFIIILLSVLIRTVYINADPPEDFSFSAALYTDEGFKVYEARNHELFGDWKWTPMDEYSGWKNQSPLSVFTYAYIFNLFGVSFYSVRGVSIVYSILTLLLLYLFIKRKYNEKCALLCSLIFGTSFFLIMYNRLGLYETHLNFYIMTAFFSFTEAFTDKKKSAIKSEVYKRRAIWNIFFNKFILITIGFAALAAAFLIKKSIILVLAAFVPALIIIGLKKYFYFRERKLRTTFAGILILFGLFYILSAHFKLIDIFIPGFSQNDLIINKILYQTAIFSPLHIMLGKALFLETVFLEPIIFLTGIIFAVFSIYEFLKNEAVKNTDFLLSCWLVFGFIMLTLLEYNPARYYMLIIIPLVILCGRCLLSLNNNNLKIFILEKQVFTFGILKKTVAVFAAAYSVIVAIFYFLPFKLKKNLMQSIYEDAGNGFPHANYIILSAAFFLLIVVTLYYIFKKKYLQRVLNYHRLANVLIVLILLTQLFQYSKWALFHNNKMFETSQELNREIEANAIIAGSWSAGFVLENKHRALVLQKDSQYNNSLLEKIILGKEIPISAISENFEAIAFKNKIPVYLAVSPKTTFEKTIFNRYEKYLRKNNLFKIIELGYFDVFIYKI